ncbi:hypothetical protein Tco_1385837 [Tanacetum coccineum]
MLQPSFLLSSQPQKLKCNILLKIHKGSSQPEGEHIKKDKGKKAMSSKDAEEVSTESDSDDETTYVPGFMVESSKKKDLKKFDFVTEDGEHVHLTIEQISAHNKIEEEAKAKAARHEGEMRKEELIDLLGPEVVNKYYNDKLHYDRYYDKILNRRAKSRITNCDILTRKGPITLKVYREYDISKIIPEFKASDLHLGEWREVVKSRPNKKSKGWMSIYKQIQERMDYLRTTEAELRIDLDRPLSEQDPLDRLNDLENKKRKHADDMHDFFKANKGSSHQFNMKIIQLDFVTSEDFRDFSNTLLYIVQEIFFRLHQGPGFDGPGFDGYSRTFSSLLLAEIDKINLNPLKQMRVIEQLRQYNKLKHVVSLLEGFKRRKKNCFKSKGNKEISLGKMVIQARVEDLQLGVESYQMKLNLTKPRTQDVDMSRGTAYNTLSNPQGVIYEDKLKRKRFMRADELYKFSNDTLISVRNTLYQKLHESHLEYNTAIRRRL